MLYLSARDKFTTVAVIGSLLLISISQAQAVTFTGTSTGSWGLPSNPSASTFISNENGGINNRLTWGVPVSNSFTNYVEYDGARFNTDVNNLFRVGDLTYRNGRITNFFNGDFTLRIVLFLSNPFSGTQSFTFNFNILNTDNNTGDPILDGDRLRLATNGVSRQTFRDDVANYTLQLVGFSTDGGITIENELNAPEDSTATSSLYARITPVPLPKPVPEPVTSSGLFVMGLYMASRLSRKVGTRPYIPKLRSRSILETDWTMINKDGIFQKSECYLCDIKYYFFDNFTNNDSGILQ